MYQVQDLLFGSWVPIFVDVWDIAQLADLDDQLLVKRLRAELLRFPECFLDGWLSSMRRVGIVNQHEEDE